MTLKDAEPGILPPQYSNFALAEPAVTGGIDNSNVQEFKTGLQSDIDSLRRQGKQPKMVLDLTQVSQLKGMALRALMEISKDLRKNHGEIVLANVSDAVKENLNMVGFTRTTTLGTPAKP